MSAVYNLWMCPETSKRLVFLTNNVTLSLAHPGTARSTAPSPALCADSLRRSTG